MSLPETQSGKPRSTRISFYIRRAKDGFRWRCKHRNGRIIAESGEAYKSKYELKLTLTNLISAIGQGDCAVVDQTKG